MTDREIEEQIVDPAMEVAHRVLAERRWGGFRPLGEVTPVVAAQQAHVRFQKPDGARPTKPLNWK